MLFCLFVVFRVQKNWWKKTHTSQWFTYFKVWDHKWENYSLIVRDKLYRFLNIWFIEAWSLFRITVCFSLMYLIVHSLLCVCDDVNLYFGQYCISIIIIIITERKSNQRRPNDIFTNEKTLFDFDFCLVGGWDSYYPYQRPDKVYWRICSSNTTTTTTTITIIIIISVDTRITIDGPKIYNGKQKHDTSFIVVVVHTYFENSIIINIIIILNYFHHVAKHRQSSWW